MTKERHVFLCHASEDKQHVLVPLVNALKESGISYWYDQAEIRWGQSITEKVNDGLRVSQFVIVLFSEAFLTKTWPKRELNSALNQEASTGVLRVLPLLIGTPEQHRKIRDEYPILNDKAFMTWDKGIPAIIGELKALMSGSPATETRSEASPKTAALQVFIPKIPKRYTQQDKDRFVREGFGIIRGYFENGAAQINRKYQEIAVEVTEIHQTKFLCTVYHHGDLVNRCKIWIGGLASLGGISYSHGTLMDVHDDNSFNDWLVIGVDGKRMGFKATTQALSFPGNNEFDQILTAEKAAEYLWRRATELLNHS